MELEKYFDLNISESHLFGHQNKVISGTHGVFVNEKGEHYATAFHIYRGDVSLAKTELKTFLKLKFPGSSDLTNEYKRTNNIEYEVEYANQGYSLKKIKLEWVAELYKRENGVIKTTENIVQPKSISKIDDISLHRHTIELTILPLLDTISKSKIFTSDEDSNKKLFNDIFELIKNNPEKYEVLSLVYYPIIFEKICSYLMVNSSVFHKIIIDENKDKDDSKLTIHNYVSALKKHKAPYSNDYSNTDIRKQFADIDYFKNKRNDLVHNQYKEIEFLQIMSNSQGLLNLLIDIIEEYD